MTEIWKLVSKGEKIFCTVNNGWGEVIESNHMIIQVVFLKAGQHGEPPTSTFITYNPVFGSPIGSGNTKRTLYFGEPDYSNVLKPAFKPTYNRGDRIFFTHKDSVECGVGIVKQETENSIILSMYANIDFLGDGHLNTDVTLLKTEFDFHPR